MLPNLCHAALRLLCLLGLGFVACLAADAATPSPRAPHQPEFSRAGFYPLADTGRSAASLNTAWRFLKADAVAAEGGLR